MQQQDHFRSHLRQHRKVLALLVGDPNLPLSAWTVLVLIADGASSNKRLMAYLQQTLPKQKQQGR
eukprot:6714963-Alexandrium_andersonii.AAC.1